MFSRRTPAQRICSRAGVSPQPPGANSRVGIADEVVADAPVICGQRHLPEGDFSGWMLWAGDSFSEADDFFTPLCVEHLRERCPEVLPYLALPPGWSFAIGTGLEDLWFNPALLERPAV